MNNNICVLIENCKKIIIKDNYDWNEINPNTNVIHTLIVLKYKNIDYTIYNQIGYKNEIEIKSENLNLGINNKIEDEFYQINITYTLENNSKIKLFSEVFNKCNIDCKINNFIIDYLNNNECDSCDKNKKQDILNIILKSELLCYSITCSKSKVWEIYNYINNLLLKYNCTKC